jgi:hypothetical protein
MIRVILFCMYLLFIGHSYAQNDVQIEVSFLKKNKQINNVSYYIIEGENALLLDLIDNRINFDSTLLIKDELKLLAIDGNTKIEFFVEPRNVYYLKK